MFSIKNKILVVTGGNGLIGKQMITTFRENGAIAISVDIKYQQQGDDDFVMDITSENSVKSVIGTILKKYNRIDGWVNNAYPRNKNYGKKFFLLFQNQSAIFLVAGLSRNILLPQKQVHSLWVVS